MKQNQIPETSSIDGYTSSEVDFDKYIDKVKVLMKQKETQLNKRLEKQKRKLMERE